MNLKFNLVLVISSLFLGSFAHGASLATSTVNFNESGFIDVFGATDNKILAAPSTGSIISTIVGVNVWNDNTGAKWTTLDYATRSASDQLDVFFTFTIATVSGYNATNNSGANQSGADIWWDSAGNFIFSHKTNGTVGGALITGKELVQTVNMTLGNHITITAAQTTAAFSSQNSLSSSGFEYGHYGYLNSAGNPFSAESPELHVTAASVQPLGWEYANNRSVINPNGPATAITGTGANDTNNLNSTDAALNIINPNVRGYIMKTYFQGVDGASDPANAGGLASSFLSFSVTGGTIVPEPSTTILVCIGTLISLTRRKSGT
jgi:hypothetical protein